MRKFVFVFAALFCLSMSAAAQDSTADSSATLESASPASEPAEPAAPKSLSPADREAWQIGAGFEYLHYKSLGVTSNDYGYHTAFTRFFTNRLAAEATLYSGFGHTTTSPHFTAKSIFVGAGPHYAFITAGRFEPWVHVIPGFQHFRFTQGAILGNNNGFGLLGGGGVDYKFGGRAYWRFQADYVGTRVGGQFNSSYAFGTGILFNF
jgi:outer membrane protein W